MKNSNTSILDRIFKFLFRSNKKQDLSGSIYPTGSLTNFNKKYNLEIPIKAIRPVNNSLSDTQSLIEMAYFGYEIRHSISIISRDCFQTLDGKVASWKISDKFNEKKINKRVVEIGDDLANRTFRKEYVLGGNKLKKAVEEFLFYGDSFLELSVIKNADKVWEINNSIFLPTLSTFVNMDESGYISEYSQREYLYPSPNDRIIHPLKMLHFSYEKKQVYGQPITYQSIPAWERFKKISEDLEQAARDTGYSLLVHTLPEGSSETDRQLYEQRNEQMLSQGILTNLYLLPGVEVERIAANAGALEPLIKVWLQYRYQLIPPGIPHWFFPGMGLESASGKDIANQPALNYARLIAFLRSILGEQIKWAISIEMILKESYEFYEENKNFEITWGEWLINENNSSESSKEPTKND